MTALVDEIRDADLDRSSLVSVNSDDLSGRAYYYYYSRPSNSSQTSTSSSGTTASSDEESSDAADDGTIKIYVNSGLFQAPYFLFYTDSSRTTSFGTNELDVSKSFLIPKPRAFGHKSHLGCGIEGVVSDMNLITSLIL